MKHFSKAIFMDRDGTVSEELGYMYHAGLYKPFPWTGEAVRRINESGFGHSNYESGRSGSRYFPESMVHEVHNVLDAELNRWSAHLDGIYYCPHSPEAQCDCRKPKPGMILRASREMNIELEGSYMIGDRYVDVEAAHGAGVKSVLLRSGDGLIEFEKHGKTSSLQPHFVADNLLHAVEAILNGLVK